MTRLALFAKHAADDVDQRPARPHVLRGARAMAALDARQRAEVVGFAAQRNLRSPPQRAHAAAGRVDEHAVVRRP